MTDLKDVEQVKALQSNLRASLDTPVGKEVMKFLEEICGWYDFVEINPDIILIKHGKRQVLATIKTLLELNPDQIVAYVKREDI
jgi:orotidine-5'-phosphate decarboxylase